MNSEQGRKPFFEFNNAYLYKENVLNADTFQKEFCDLIVTSPPYNVGIEYKSNDDVLSYNDYLKFTKEWIANCFYWAKDSCRLILNIPLDKNKGGQKSVGADITTIAQKIGWKYHSTIVWNEGNISRRTAWGSFMSASAPYVIAPVELIVVLYKTDWKKIGGSKISDISKADFLSWTNGLWTFNGESKKRIGHPAPFPKELPYRAIKLFSYVGDIVLDPFSGSGTTALVAAMNKRIGVGLDIDAGYCNLAKRRILHELDTLNLEEPNESNVANGVDQEFLYEKPKKKT
jgi:site-specific DNA-methyltransferase (adenine-specific)